MRDTYSAYRYCQKQGRENYYRSQMVEKLAVSVAEAAKLISVSKSTVYAMIEQGRLPVIRITAKRLIVPLKALETWLEIERGSTNGSV